MLTSLKKIGREINVFSGGRIGEALRPIYRLADLVSTALYIAIFIPFLLLAAVRSCFRQKARLVTIDLPSQVPSSHVAGGSHYDVFGVQAGADVKEIKKAYRQLAKLHHPDKQGNPELFKKINSAYQELTDVKKRKAYDADLTFRRAATTDLFFRPASTHLPKQEPKKPHYAQQASRP
jgi:hypothetical protein